MLQVHFGLNAPYTSAFNAARQQKDPNTVLPLGTWVIVDPDGMTAGITGATAADGLGAEILWGTPSNMTMGGGHNTLDGKFEATTDQFTGTIAAKDKLVIKAGKLCTANADKSEDLYIRAVAISAGTPGGKLRFKTL